MPLTIASVDASGALVLYSRESDAWRRTTPGPHGLWPAWAPNGQLLSLSRVETASDEPTSQVNLVSREGTPAGMAWESPRGVAPVIAPRIPHYVLWSPVGDLLAFVCQGEGALDLRLSAANGSLQGAHVASGAPIFASWAPDGTALAVHAGPELFLVRAGSPAERVAVAGQAIGYRTPAFSGDGGLLAAALPAPPGTQVVVSDPPGAPVREICRLPGGVALAFRPGSRELTVAVSHQPGTGVFDELVVCDPHDGHGAPRRLVRGPFVAFFWAPTGERFVTIVPAQTGDGRYCLQLRDADGRFVSATEPFLPSVDTRTQLGFFDQYGLSHRPWAPDGSAFAVAGRVLSDSLSASFADDVGDDVLLWQPGRGQPLERLGRGELAAFAPATG